MANSLRDLVDARHEFEYLDLAVTADASSAGTTELQLQQLLANPTAWLKHIDFLVDDLKSQLTIKQDEINLLKLNSDKGSTPDSDFLIARAKFLFWRARTMAFCRSLKRRRQVVLHMIKTGVFE
ncbi:MAG: hypothetical protein AABY46_04040 [Nitrospirota bacterium]